MRRVLIPLILAGALALVGVGAGAAGAVPAGTIGTYPTWTVGGTANAFSATAAFASPSLPDPAITSDSAALQSASGASAFLGPGTSFGQEFGTTRSQPYLTLRPRSGSPAPTPPSVGTPPPSTTTIDFGATAPAAGWGFALGDIDADWVFVRAYDANGVQLPVSALGERAVGNYCDSTPRPSACTGTVAPYDVPNWVTTPTTVAYGASSITWAPGTVYGNVADTAGAYAWFTPDAAVRRIVLSYGALSGSPVFQLWVSQPAPVTTISGTVSLGDRPGAAVPPGTAVQLDDADGTPVTALDGDPVQVPVDAQGAYAIETEQRDAYRLTVIPPAGYAAPAPILVSPATGAAVAVAPIALAPVAAPPAPAAVDPAAELAPTGVDALPAAVVAGILLLVGSAVLVTRRRRL